MTDLVLERDFDEALTMESFVAGASRLVGCLDLYRVEWRQSMMAKNRKHMVCWFRGADAESIRIALRMNDVNMRTLWRGTWHESPTLTAETRAGANVAVERDFDTPMTVEAIQSIEDAGAACLEMRNVEAVGTLAAADNSRMICLYRALDAESVRDAQREAGVPFTAVWAFDLFTPAVMASLR